MSREKALAAKAVGNKHFAAKNFEEAIKAFTEAIKHDPGDHVFFSNRSACYANLHKFEEALEDGTICVNLKPDWPKGYSRKGFALYSLKRFEEAKLTYEEGLKHGPDDVALKEGLASTEKATNASPLNSLFGPQMWGRLAANPMTREFLNDPAFVQKLKMLQANPQNMSLMQSDPRIQQSLGVILGLGADFGRDDAPVETEEERQQKRELAEREEQARKEEEARAKAEAEEKKKAEEAASMSPEELEERKTKQAEQAKRAEAAKSAAAEKAAGNDHYKNRRFEEALTHYRKAAEMDPYSLSYHSNIAAVYMEQKKFEECIKACNAALEVSKKYRGDFKLLAKVYGRMGNACLKLNDLEGAILAFEKSLMEDSDDKINKILKRTLEMKKKREEEAYLSEELSLKAKEEGNELFKNGKWVEAIERYSEAIKRNPKAHTVYSNRAACYTKLMDWQRGLDDVEKCIELEPSFVKAYIRKGKIQHFLKQYHKALETYQQGLTLDPNASELIEGIKMTQRAIQQENQSGEVDPRRAQEAMKDPEIQAILSDPAINNILQQMQTNPEVAQRALADATVRAKINKLVAAGILRIG